MGVNSGPLAGVSRRSRSKVGQGSVPSRRQVGRFVRHELCERRPQKRTTTTQALKMAKSPSGPAARVTLAWTARMRPISRL